MATFLSRFLFEISTRCQETWRQSHRFSAKAIRKRANGNATATGDTCCQPVSRFWSDEHIQEIFRFSLGSTPS